MLNKVVIFLKIAGRFRTFALSTRKANCTPAPRRRTALVVTGDLLHCRVKSTCDSSCFSASLTARKAVFVVEKRVD